MSARISRPSARVVVVDPDERVLLVRVLDPTSGRPAVWITPGGGVEQGEDLGAAAVRELAEETGLVVDVADLGRPVAVSRGEWEFRGQLLYSEDWYFGHRTARFDPDESGWTALERELHTGWHWWSLEELDRTTEVIIPGGLAGLVRRLRTQPGSWEPIELEWVVA